MKGKSGYSLYKYTVASVAVTVSAFLNAKLRLFLGQCITHSTTK